MRGRRTRIINEISPAVGDMLCRDIQMLEALHTSYRSGSDSLWVPPGTIEKAEQRLLDVVSNAALACYIEDEDWFVKQNPAELARQLVPRLLAVAFGQLYESHHGWLKQLLARPRIGGKDNTGKEGLVKCVEDVIAARQNTASWVPRQPSADVPRIIQRMRNALESGQSFRHLMIRRVELTQAQIANRMNVHRSMVTRIVQYGGKGVSEEKIQSFFKIVAGNIKPV